METITIEKRLENYFAGKRHLLISRFVFTLQLIQLQEILPSLVPTSEFVSSQQNATLKPKHQTLIAVEVHNC